MDRGIWLVSCYACHINGGKRLQVQTNVGSQAEQSTAASMGMPCVKPRLACATQIRMKRDGGSG